MKGFLIAILMMLWGLMAALLIAPYGDGFISYARYCTPITVCCFGWAWYWLAGENRIIGHGLPNVLIAISSAVTLFLITTVSFRNEIAGKEILGTITGTGRSSNHQYPVVRISGLDGKGRLEGVAEDFFQSAHKEDHVEKRAGAVVALLNGKPTPIIRRSILDAIRLGTR